jgi:hypothetical protein
MVIVPPKIAVNPIGINSRDIGIPERDEIRLTTGINSAAAPGLEAGQQMDTWGLFSVTPIGIALVITGIVYFVIAGKFVLPATKKDQSESISAIEHFHHKLENFSMVSERSR